MLDPAYVRDHLSEVEARLRARGIDPSTDLAELAALEAERRRLIPAVENLKREQNAAGEAVARAKKAGQDPSAVFAENKARGGRIKELAASGTSPRSTNGMMKRHPSSARTKSQWNNIVVPIPTAFP